MQKRVNRAVTALMEIALPMGWGREDNVQVNNGEKCYRDNKLGFVMEDYGER